MGDARMGVAKKIKALGGAYVLAKETGRNPPLPAPPSGAIIGARACFAFAGRFRRVSAKRSATKAPRNAPSVPGRGLLNSDERQDPADMNHFTTPPPPPHGGDLAAARRRYPEAPQPFLDLSTGIAPRAYPLAGFPAEVLTRLPEPAEIGRLCALAAARFGAPEGARVVAAPGTQILLPLVAALRPPGTARVLGPTYAEHARAARLAGHAAREVAEAAALVPADLVTVVNPDNPTGRVLAAEFLAQLAARQRACGGLLVVDEAFQEAEPGLPSAVPLVAEGHTLVLRSFGKFHGLAGLRLGFAVLPAPLASRLEAMLGPWAVSGPALHAGLAALTDDAWAAAQRAFLAGTPLFRFVAAPPGTQDRLGRAGILVRGFPHWPDRLRIGLPGDDAGFARLRAALA
jgi:cobalamin biosynthetic protein CobC